VMLQELAHSQKERRALSRSCPAKAPLRLRRGHDFW